MKYINNRLFTRLSNTGYLTSFVILCTAMMLANSINAATLNLSNRPLFLGTTVEPNIFLVIDDSGSMDWEVLKSSGALTAFGTGSNSGNLNFNPGNDTDRRELCVGYNVLAFNPSVNYSPWSGLDSNGNPYPDQTLTAARNNPSSSAGTRNLTGDYYYPWVDNGDNVFQSTECRITNGDRIFINTLPASAKTNYANWYSYYRKREYVAKAAYGSVVINAQASRLGMMTLNRNNNVNMPIRSMNSDFNIGNKRALMDKLYNINSSGGTPLQNAMSRAGEYMTGKSSASPVDPWLENGSSEQFIDPRLSIAEGGQCQQHFSIVMTDGYYNGTYDGALRAGNADNDGVKSDGSPSPWDQGLYGGTTGDTLADIAMKYYEDDLLDGLVTPGKPDLIYDNTVPKNLIDLNEDQHIVTYTVAFGVDGTLRCSPGETLDSLGNACPSPFPGWPDTGSDARRIDDLRHAAYNGRGLYLSAENPQSLIQSVNEAIGDIISRTSSSAGVSFNSTSIDTDTVTFQANYTTSDWSGDLLFMPIGGTGAIGTEIASAKAELDNIPASNRIMLTYRDDTSAGVAFRWTDISPAQQIALGNPDILDYLRGDKSCEVSSALTCVSGNKNLRNRSSALGDIINSGTTYVAAPKELYGFSNYNGFFNANKTRTPMAYVGSNDGFLHGFEASVTSAGAAIAGSTAVERIAYTPSFLFSRLRNITDPSYAHSYYVDGSPSVGDAYYGLKWHTVLVGGMNAGGQGIYALDVTDPGSFAEANAASLVLWEFSDADDADLGYTYSKPSIVKLADDRFYAVFGNGYNSTIADGTVGSGEAVLFLVDIETGIGTKISTGVGTLADPNGLSTPLLVDVDGDFIKDYAYAGDLHGNMWRFDLTDNTSIQWKLSFAKTPLFTAISPEGNRQFITSRPSVSDHPEQDGSLVYFGTGKYLETTDNITVGQPTQTFYGIWDKWTKTTGDSSFATFNRTDLLQQEILVEPVYNNTDVRVTSDYTANWSTHHGWYIDLVNIATNDNQGERQVSASLTFDGQIIFTTLIPSAASCESGGTGWIMALNALDGSRLVPSAFDTNGDNTFDDADKIQVTIAGVTKTVTISGAKSKKGIISEPVIVRGKGGITTYVAVGNSEGNVGLGDIFPGTVPPGGVKPPVGKNGQANLIGRTSPFGRILWKQIK